MDDIASCYVLLETGTGTVTGIVFGIQLEIASLGRELSPDLVGIDRFAYHQDLRLVSWV